MAAVTLRDGQKFDSADVFKHVENFLPAYARPRFIRIRVCLFHSSYISAEHFDSSFCGVWSISFMFFHPSN